MSALLVALGVAAVALVGRRSREAASFASVTLVRGLPATWRTRFRWLPGSLQQVALAASLIAMTGPSCKTIATQTAGPDVFFLVDVSLSMRGMDLEPDRLRRAKAIVRDSLARVEGGRFGLGLFAGTHALACPITIDRRAFLERLDRIEPSGGDGTAVGTATLAALDVVRRAGSNTGTVVVVTDGASTRDDVAWPQVARRAFDTNTPVAVLQTGAGGQVPMPTDFGIITVETVDETPRLQALAHDSGGIFVDARQTGAADHLGAWLGARAGHHHREEAVMTDATWLWAALAALALFLRSAAAEVLRLC